MGEVNLGSVGVTACSDVYYRVYDLVAESREESLYMNGDLQVNTPSTSAIYGTKNGQIQASFQPHTLTL